MIFDYEPGDYVINPKNKECGKKTIIADKVLLEKINVKN